MEKIAPRSFFPNLGGGELMDLTEHRLIPTRDFERLLKYAKAVDTALGLWYSGQQKDAPLDHIMELSSNLMRQRVTLESILTILRVDRQFFALKENKRQDERSPYTINVTSEDEKNMAQLMKERESRFVEKLNNWIEENPNKTELGPIDLSEVLLKTKAPPPKISKQNIEKKRSLSKDLRNNPSKYKYKERNEKALQVENKGLSLLERIRQKEASRTSELLNKNPVKQYDSRIRGKMVPVYEIIYQMRGAEDQHSYKSYPLAKMVQTVKDSLGYPISEDDLGNVISKLEEILSKNKLQTISKDNLAVIKVKSLDRKQDLKALKESLGNFKG